MSFLRKKSIAERAAEGLARRVDTKALGRSSAKLARSGVRVVGSVASLAAASAIVSAVRKKEQN